MKHLTEIFITLVLGLVVGGGIYAIWDYHKTTLKVRSTCVTLCIGSKKPALECSHACSPTAPKYQ